MSKDKEFRYLHTSCEFQENAECLCKPKVEGEKCDTCTDGTFDLQQMNPDGCTECFCSGKTTFCNSHDRLIRTKVKHRVEILEFYFHNENSVRFW